MMTAQRTVQPEKDAETRDLRDRGLLARRNERLSRRIERLERENRQLKEFAAMAAHEMIKPLVMTETCATAIRERSGHGLDIISRQELDIIINVSSRVRVLVEALLLDARDGNRTLHEQHVELGSVLRESLTILSREIAARKATIEVEELPTVRGNAALLGGVLTNLLANALKYGPAHGTTIKVTATRSDAGWTLGVESAGRPIPENERRAIFEPFRRGVAGRRVHGAGLGLAVVRQIVERHGGEVGVTTADESGNRFFFTLPA